MRSKAAQAVSVRHLPSADLDAAPQEGWQVEVFAFVDGRLDFVEAALDVDLQRQPLLPPAKMS